MSFTCDFTTDIGKVRALTGDTLQDMVFVQDEQIQCYLDMTDTNWSLSAAMCLEAMANNAAIIQQKIKSLDIQTDGASVAKALKDAAKILRDNVNDENINNFDIAVQCNTDFARRDRIFNAWFYRPEDF